MRMLKKIAALSVMPSLILTGYAMGRVSDNMPEVLDRVYAQPAWCGPEDGPRFNAAKCGNRTMGVYVDVTPNNGKRDGEWLNLTFKKGHDDRGTFKPRSR